MFLEQISSVIMGVIPLAFQVIVLIKYPSIPSLLSVAAILLVVLFASVLRLVLDDLILSRSVFLDVISRYKGAQFEEVSDSEHNSPLELFNLQTAGSIPSFLQPFSKTLSKDSQRRNVKIYRIKATPNTNIFLPGGQCYRSSFFSKSYIFLGSGNKTLNKFIMLHELGHLSFTSNAEKTRAIVLRTVYITLIFCATWQINWSPLAVFLYAVLILQMSDHFGYKAVSEERLAKIQGEIHADKFAVSRLSIDERQYILEIIDKGYLNLDPKLSQLDNNIRITALKESLAKGQNNYDDWLSWDLGGLLQKVTVILVIAAFFSRAPTYVGAMLLFAFAIFLFVFIRLCALAQRQQSKQISIYASNYAIQ